MRTSRTSALRALWQALRGARDPGSPSLLEHLLAIPRMIGAVLRGRYRGTTKGSLGLMAVAAAYVISPVDVIPEALLSLAGLADDAVVLVWLAGSLLAETGNFLEWEREQQRTIPGTVLG